LIVLEDVSELEARAQRMKLASLGMLTANLAHEIRNPLSAIRHAAGLLREGAGDGMAARLTRIIEDNTRRLNALVEDVLALNRRDRVRRETVDVAGFLAPFIQQFTQREGVAAGVITLDAREGLNICMDVGHLEQILWNLLRNAWRYCSRGAGSIRVRAETRGNTVEIVVFNDGPPISREVRAHLFEPFYTTEKQGSGLGLYIARELAEANAAYLRCPEHADGTGFVLRCQVPPC
jgi:two-component system sensor histidine kinase PilS (NtrC family)